MNERKDSNFERTLEESTKEIKENILPSMGKKIDLETLVLLCISFWDQKKQECFSQCMMCTVNTATAAVRVAVAARLVVSVGLVAVAITIAIAIALLLVIAE
jgi:hypothetical protein